MARHKKAETPPIDEPALDISSLIDCTFLLLIYFLVTTTIQKREQDLDMKLPAQQQTQEQPPIEPKFIKIDQNGAVYVGAGPAQQLMDTDTSVRELPMLRQDLEIYSSAAKAADSQPLVQIYVEGDAQQQRVIDVLNALAGAKINQVTFTDLVDPP
jgi:biopolymer transport protein ExbD